MSDELKSLVGDIVPTPEPAAEPVSSDQGMPPEKEGEVTPTPEPQAPAATPPVVQTNAVPLPVFMDLKHENAELRRQLLQTHPGVQPAATTPPVERPKDPLLVYKEKYSADFEEENGRPPTDAEIPVSYGVIAQRDQWIKDIEAAEQEERDIAIRKNSIQVAQTQTMTDAAFGEGLGIDAVTAIGSKYLSEGDKVDIANAGDQCATVIYRKCLARAVQSGTPEGAALAARVQQKFAQDAVSPTPPIVKDEVVTPSPPSANEVVGRHPILQSLGLKGYGNTA